MSAARQNLKGAVSKTPVWQTETGYEAFILGEEANTSKARYLYGKCERICSRYKCEGRVYYPWITESCAWKSASNGRGPWWNSRASHMNQAFPKKFFDRLGLVSLLDTILRFRNNSRTAVYGTVRTVV